MKTFQKNRKTKRSRNIVKLTRFVNIYICHHLLPLLSHRHSEYPPWTQADANFSQRAGGLVVAWGEELEEHCRKLESEQHVIPTLVKRPAASRSRSNKLEAGERPTKKVKTAENGDSD